MITVIDFFVGVSKKDLNNTYELYRRMLNWNNTLV